MGYSKFDGNEMDIMEYFMKHPNVRVPTNEFTESYPYQIKSLLRKKMLEKIEGNLIITKRGLSAVEQQYKTGEYWVAPLKPKPFVIGGGALRIPSSMSEYVGQGGWFKDSAGHRQAALKGADKRRAGAMAYARKKMRLL